MKVSKQSRQKNIKLSILLKFCFFCLTANFIFILAQFFLPVIRDTFTGTFLFLMPFFIFFLLGIGLVFLTIKEGVKGKLRRLLILTGSSAAGILISIFMHNFIYAVSVYFWGKEMEEPVFFLLGIIVFPLVFMFSAIISLSMFLKKNGN